MLRQSIETVAHGSVMMCRRHAVGITASAAKRTEQVPRAALARLAPRAKVLAIRLGAVGIERSVTQNLHTVFKFTGSDTMSIFEKIMSAIFGPAKADAPAAGTTTAAGGAPPAAGSASAGRESGGAPAATAAPAQTVDVAPILDKAVAAKGEKLEWRTSIVDLMKALDIDSSFSARKELAKELGYTGDSNDSASMNIWLHKQVMAKFAANGGKLPPEIKH
jgi:Domain of unknown function (DUF3597)